VGARFIQLFHLALLWCRGKSLQYRIIDAIESRTFPSQSLLRFVASITSHSIISHQMDTIEVLPEDLLRAVVCLVPEEIATRYAGCILTTKVVEQIETNMKRIY
jgi:hypothetical protein